MRPYPSPTQAQTWGTRRGASTESVSYTHLDVYKRQLLAGVDTTPDSPRGTGGRDWSDLPGRMHFIADLFRAYHEDATLFDPPFAD